MAKRLLITGASGFIGGHLTSEAIALGYEVWAGVRHSSHTKELEKQGVKLLVLNYENPQELCKQLEEVGNWDYIIHNAGVTKTTNPTDFYQVNHIHTKHLLDALNRLNQPIKKFLFMSSLGVYGPTAEKEERGIQLNDPQIPNSDYGKSKQLAELTVAQNARMPYLIIRPTGVYGPGDKDYFLMVKSIKQGLDVATGVTPQRLSFIYVKDLAKSILFLMDSPLSDRAFFMDDGKMVTDREFSLILQQILKKKHLIRLRIPLFLVHAACAVIGAWGNFRKKAVTLNLDKYQILKQRNWATESDLREALASIGKEMTFRSLEEGFTETIEWYKQKGWL